MAPRLAFINTRLPGMTFLARDMIFLAKAGIPFDLYLFDPEDLDAGFRAEVERNGGVVRKIAFPFSVSIVLACVRELLSHPIRLLGSIGIALDALRRDSAEGLRALGTLPAALALGRELRASGTTQVHGLWAGVPATVGYWIARHAGLAFSFSGHAWDITGRTALLPRKVAAARGMVVCSRFARATVCRQIQENLWERVALVHHGLDLSRWGFERRADRPEAVAGRSPGRDRPLRIVAVGRLTPKKGYEYLVEACGLLAREGMAVQCEFIGPDAGVGEQMRQRIRTLGLESTVVLAGTRSEAEVHASMRSADLLVCPSVKTTQGDSDGIANVVLEAMAVGLPVVATDVGGLAEVVLPGETGLLVPSRDTVALASAIRAVGADLPGAWRRAERARQNLVKEFAGPATVEEFLQGIGIDANAQEGTSHAAARPS